MATEIVYIDPVLGDDVTGTVGDPNLPFEHIQEGVNALTIGSDGIAILVPGIYIEDSGGTNYCALNRSLASLTITPTVNYSSTIKAAAIGGQQAVISADGVLTVFNIGKVIIDAEISQTSHILFSGAIALSAVIDGSKFINCESFVIASTALLTSFIMQNGWSAINAPRVISMLPDQVGAQINISDGLIFNDSVDFTRAPIIIRPTADDTEVIIDNVEFDYTTTPTATSHRYMILLDGSVSIHIKNNRFRFNSNGSAATASGVGIQPDTVFIPTSVIVEDNDFGSDDYSQIDYGILIGSNTTANSHRINGVIIRRNKITNADQAVVFGYITGAKSYSNTISSINVACLAQGTIECEHATNLITNAANQSLYVQFDTNSVFANNTCIAKTVSPDGHFYSTYHIFAGGDNSHGTLFVNNIVLDFIGDNRLIYCEATSTAKYKNNNLYQPSGSSTEKYYYKGLITDSLGELRFFVNLVTPGGMSGNLEVSPEFNPQKNYELLSTSPLIGAGLNWWGEGRADPVGINEHPFWGSHVDLGANSTWDGSARRTPAPKRLTTYRHQYTP